MTRIENVSVVVPTYGREAVLVETLRRLLDAVPAPGELLVVDQTDRHAESTERVLREEHRAGRLRWIRHRPPGVVGAMNRGLAEARGEIVLFLDDDILPSPNLPAAHRAVYRAFPEAWAAVGRVLQPEDDDTPEPGGVGGKIGRRRGDRPSSPLRRDLEFRFNGIEPAWVENVMAGNLSVRRDRALAIGGFDENFLPPVAYRFETEFAKRLIAAGGRIRFEPSAEIRHLRAVSGGTRSIGSHLTSASPLHGVGDYYYALRRGRGWDRASYLARRPFREVRTRFHLRHPWWIPVKFIGELRALVLAFRLYRRARAGRPPNRAPPSSEAERPC